MSAVSGGVGQCASNMPCTYVTYCGGECVLSECKVCYK